LQAVIACTEDDLLDKLFWVFIAVTPETVVRWHKGRFRLTERDG